MNLRVSVQQHCTYAVCDVISVNRPLYSSTVVGTVTTFGIGGRTDVNGGVGSIFAMMISHGQRCSWIGS